MERQPVKSSNIKSVGYDPATKTLEMEFHTGKVYRFRDVPGKAHSDLMQASSKGSHFARHIKNRYQFDR